jgi:hypothetical protein
MVGGDNDPGRCLRKASHAAEAGKRGVLEGSKLACALTQRGLEPGNGSQRFVDDDEIEELIPRARRLAALTQTVLESGSGYTHSECIEVRLPCPMSRLRAVPAAACRCRGMHTMAPPGPSDDP